MAKILGIDYGLERTGLAITDPEGKVAFPLAALRLHDFPNRKALLDSLAQKATEAGAEIIVIGLPLYPDGKENEMCAVVRNAAARIKRRLALPLYFMPETLSSEEAATHLAQAGIKGMKKKAFLDMQAACEIIESFIAAKARMSA